MNAKDPKIGELIELDLKKCLDKYKDKPVTPEITQQIKKDMVKVINSWIAKLEKYPDGNVKIKGDLSCPKCSSQSVMLIAEGIEKPLIIECFQCGYKGEPYFTGSTIPIEGLLI